MASLEVDLTTYSDADFGLSQQGPFANGLTSIGTNPLHMQVRTSSTDPTVWLEADTANATAGSSASVGLITVTIGTGGAADTVNITIPQTMLVNLPPGTYVYSIIMSSVFGRNRTEIMRGTLTHNSGPTQWAAGTA